MTDSAPDAELMIATGCSHCPAVLAALAELVKAGTIGRLQVTNITTNTDPAAADGVRSVPWTRIGPFELPGVHTRRELAAYAQRAGSEDGRREYLSEMLATGRLDVATGACRRHASLLGALLALTGDLETPFAVRVGAAAIIEDLAGEGLLRDHGPALLALARAPDPQVRADAAHFLGLADTPGGRLRLRELLEDADDAVREIARDALAELGDAAPD